MNIAILATVGKTLINFIPTIASTIVSLEEVDSTSGKGAAKKALALTILQGLYEATSPTVPWSDLVSAISKTVDAVVEFYNNEGKFLKGLKAAA